MPRSRRPLGDPRVWLAVYAVVLVAIAVWPVPVDSGSRGMLDDVTARLPWLTYARIEFGANIVLFVPLGLLLALILDQRHLVVPIALVSSVAIESVQGLLLDQRTPSVLDIVANTTGASLGLLGAALVAWLRRGHRTPVEVTAQGVPMP